MYILKYSISHYLWTKSIAKIMHSIALTTYHTIKYWMQHSNSSLFDSQLYVHCVAKFISHIKQS